MWKHSVYTFFLPLSYKSVVLAEKHVFTAVKHKKVQKTSRNIQECNMKYKVCCLYDFVVPVGGCAEDLTMKLQ